jgi:hypothetical protein
MLERVIAGVPGARFVRTGNADSNEAMLAINRELGFEPYASEVIYQFEVAQLKAALGLG